MNCRETRRYLPGYLDGAIRASEHARLREHLHACDGCREELERYRLLAGSLARLDPAAPPANLSVRIRARLSEQRAANERKGNFFARVRLYMENILEPLALPATGGILTAVLVFALVAQDLLGGIPFGAVPHDLPTNLFQAARVESVAPFPVEGISAANGRADGSVLMISATLDSRGAVVGYEIISGPDNAAVRRQLDQVLLFSHFRPQMDFGRPMSGGQVMLVFSEVRVKG